MSFTTTAAAEAVTHADIATRKTDEANAARAATNSNWLEVGDLEAAAAGSRRVEVAATLCVADAAREVEAAAGAVHMADMGTVR